MSSYKKHAIFAIILTLPFFPNVFSLALALIAASFPDFDHKVKKKNITLLFIIGTILTLILYIFKLPYLLGIILITLCPNILFIRTPRIYSFFIGYSLYFQLF